MGTDTDGLFLGDLAPGAIVGDYRIESLVAARGSGIVYQATHAVLPRRVLIKVMPATRDWTPSPALQLLREACIVEALDHPGVPRVYECGLLEDRRAWVATERVEGISLTEVIEVSPLTPYEVGTLLLDVGEILEHAHRRGVVHGGLGTDAIIIPDNLARFPIWLGDWSEARLADSKNPIPLRSRAARPFFAPEQQRGESLDSRADIYALGMVAHVALHGVPPGEQTAHAAADVPPILAGLIDQMLAHEPVRRPTSTQVRHAAQSVLELLDKDAAVIVDVPLEQILRELDDEAALSRPDPRTISSDHTLEVAGEIDSGATALADDSE